MVNEKGSIPALDLKCFGFAEGAPAAQGSEAPSAGGGETGAGQAEGSDGTGKNRGVSETGEGGGEAGSFASDENPAGAPRSDAGSEQRDSSGTEDRRSEFERLIQGEYKEYFDERVQKLINKRFKRSKLTEQQLTAQTPVVELLLRRYGIDENDADAVNRLYSQLEKDGNSADLEQNGYRKAQSEVISKLFNGDGKTSGVKPYVESALKSWLAQAGELAAEYPGFELARELKKPAFGALIRSGHTLKSAYEAMHLGEIRGRYESAAAERAEKRVLEALRRRGARPAENGVLGQSGVTLKNDVTKLSRKEREQIAKRAAKGESVVL
ncbi:MAG: hypothetical protein LBL09_00535 [Oscillospiraceae bacterium]|jgi:hypothetical protein|nr:hypothetical protein [Oscillospiraceae bacterium]